MWRWFPVVLTGLVVLGSSSPAAAQSREPPQSPAALCRTLVSYAADPEAALANGIRVTRGTGVPFTDRAYSYDEAVELTRQVVAYNLAYLARGTGGAGWPIFLFQAEWRLAPTYVIPDDVWTDAQRGLAQCHALGY